MTRRLPSAERRQQIVHAALELLADLPLEQVTTRRIADKVGVSQPALFRHFPTRLDILIAVIHAGREELREVAVNAMVDRVDWATTATKLGDVLIEHVRTHPGMIRLLFHGLTEPESPAHPALAELVSMNAALVSGLVAHGQDVGDVPAIVDAEAAGRLFMAVLQGAVLHWALRAESDNGSARDAVQMWVAGVRAGLPAMEPSLVKPSDDPLAVVALDVRPILARGDEPLDHILETLALVREDGLLLLSTPFRATPLLRLLERRGYGVQVEQVGPEHWQIVARAGACPELLDLRDLEAPEPMEALLLATGSQDVVVGWVPRIPRLLLPMLRERGLSWQLHEHSDGTALIHVHRPQ